MTLRVVGDGGEKGRPPGKPSGTFDPWDTERGYEYNPDHFYTRSTNKHDHSVDLRFKLPPHIGSMLSEIVDSKRFPALRSVNDFCRDAVIHRLHYLNEQIANGKFERGLSLEMRLARLAQQQQEIQSLEAIVQTHASALEMAYNSHDKAVLHEVLSYLEDDVSVVREPYRNQLRELGKQYRQRAANMKDPEPDD